MSKSHFAKRLKNLVGKASKLRLKETLIAKESAKYHTEMDNLIIMIKKDHKKLKILENEVRKHQSVIAKLTEFLYEEESKMKEIKQELVVLEQSNNYSEIIQMDSLHCLKELTKTYIDLNYLPDLVDVVSVCEKENSNKFINFQINPSSHTQEEVQNAIWSSGSKTLHKITSEWKSLIFE